MDNTNKFTGKSSAYASSRPKYAEQFIQYLKNSAGLGLESIVADIGSGTGILSSQLLDIGCTVIAVEPNDDMRNTAEKLLGGNERFNSVKGSAENTALEDYSVNYITVGQAFHWFDHKKFKAECKRILKPGGKVILVWNSRVSSNKMIKENAEICQKYCPGFTGFSGGIKNMDSAVSNFFETKYEKKVYQNDLKFTNEKFIQRLKSASYMIPEDSPNYEAYISALENLFDKYQKNGFLTMPNETKSYAGEI